MSQNTMLLRTDQRLKQRAQTVADKLGLSLSAVITNDLRRLVREQYVEFSNDFGRAKDYRTIIVRLRNKDFGKLVLRSRREGIPIRLLAASVLRQAAAEVPAVKAPTPPALPAGHICDKCCQPLADA